MFLIPHDIKMKELIVNAQCHVLPSFNATGVKLKLVNALYNGRYCITNKAGAEGSALEDLCIVTNNALAFTNAVKEFYDTPFTAEEIAKRSTALKPRYLINAKMWSSLLVSYGSIIINMSPFCFYNAGRKFIDNRVIMCCHDDRCTIVPGYMKQQVHDLIRCFRVKISCWLIGQYKFWGIRQCALAISNTLLLTTA